MPSILGSVLAPETDGGVALQFAVLLAITGPLMWLARGNREVLLFIVGIAVALAAAMALRMVH